MPTIQKASAIQKYAEEIPESVRAQIKILGNDENLGLLQYLSKGRVSARKMSDDLGISRKMLEKKLGPLIQRELVERGGKKAELYGPTAAGKKLLRKLVTSSIY